MKNKLSQSKISISKDKEITDDPKYNLLSNIFEKMFLRHCVWRDDSFDFQVWFLKQNPNLTKFTKATNLKNRPVDSLSKPNPMLEIIKICNEIKVTDNEQNSSTKSLEHISINVDNFIYKLCEKLITTGKIITRSEETIKMYNAHQKINIINESLKILNERIRTNSNTDLNSKLKLSLSKLENFPVGEHELEVEFLEFDENKIESMNETSCHSKEMINTKVLKLEEAVKVTNKDSTLKLNPDKFSFPIYQFKVLEINEDKISRSLGKNYSRSGTTFSNFKLKSLSKENNRTIESKTEFFLDLILIYLEDIYDTSQDVITKNLGFKLNPVSQLNSKSENPRQITLEMNLEFDNVTRSAVLKSVKEILNGVLQTKRYNENIIDEILEESFPDEAEQVKTVLFKKDESKRDSCCSGCNIF